MKKRHSYGFSINLALSYMDIDGAELAKLLRKKYVNVNRYTVRDWIEGLAKPTNDTMKKIDEIIFNGKGLLFDDDFLDCILAHRNGDKVVTNEQFRDSVDHAYALKKKVEGSKGSNSQSETEALKVDSFEQKYE